MKDICAWPGCQPDCRRDCEARRPPPTESDYPDDEPDPDADCMSCDGTGLEWGDTTCAACGGSGMAA